MFRLFNDTAETISVNRSHKYGDEPAVNFTVEPGCPFEGLETVYAYSVGERFAHCILQRGEDMGARIEGWKDAKAEEQRLKEAQEALDREAARKQQDDGKPSDESDEFDEE